MVTVVLAKVSKKAATYNFTLLQVFILLKSFPDFNSDRALKQPCKRDMEIESS
jgi:hypothetical protein